MRKSGIITKGNDEIMPVTWAENVLVHKEIPLTEVLISAPQKAEVGQVLAVKSVDFSGKPTEWECTEKGGGEGGTTDYNDLSNKPAIDGNILTKDSTANTLGLAKVSDIPTVPTRVSELENDEGYSKFSGSYNDLSNKPELFSGSYNDLTDKPTIPEVPTDLSAFNNDVGYTTFDGNYNSLNNKPEIPSIEGLYSKPEGGIPVDDMSKKVQESLEKADTALQEHQSLEDYVKTNDSRLTDARASNDVQSYAKTGSGITVGVSVPSNAKFTDTTYSVATTSASGLMSADDKTKLNGIATGANAYSLPNATSSVLGGVKIGSNISVSSGTISLSKDNVTSALGYTPPTTNTTYSSKTASSGGTDVSLVTTGEKYTWNNKASTSIATTSANGLMSSTDKTKLNGIATGATAVSESTVSGWGFTKNTGTVTSIKVGSTSYNPSSGVVSLPSYPSVTSTYSSTGTTAVNGTAVASAISEKLDSSTWDTFVGSYTNYDKSVFTKGSSMPSDFTIRNECKVRFNNLIWEALIYVTYIGNVSANAWTTILNISTSAVKLPNAASMSNEQSVVVRTTDNSSIITSDARIRLLNTGELQLYSPVAITSKTGRINSAVLRILRAVTF